MPQLLQQAVQASADMQTCKLALQPLCPRPASSHLHLTLSATVHLTPSCPCPCPQGAVPSGEPDQGKLMIGEQHMFEHLFEEAYAEGQKQQQGR